MDNVRFAGNPPGTRKLVVFSVCSPQTVSGWVFRPCGMFSSNFRNGWLFRDPVCSQSARKSILHFDVARIMPLCISMNMKRTLFFTLTLALLTATGCTQAQRNPDAIRQDAAKAAAEAKQDAKAVVQGVEDGLKTKGQVNINNATPDQLEALPGIDAARARRIIAGRPYQSSDDLVKRHLVSKAEYDRIAGQVVAQ